MLRGANDTRTQGAVVSKLLAVQPVGTIAGVLRARRRRGRPPDDAVGMVSVSSVVENGVVARSSSFSLLADERAIFREHLGGTVNDVVLALSLLFGAVACGSGSGGASDKPSDRYRRADMLLDIRVASAERPSRRSTCVVSTLIVSTTAKPHELGFPS